MLKWGKLEMRNLSNNDVIEMMKIVDELRDKPCGMKDIICKLIDAVTEPILLEWDNRYVSKDEAKEYVMNYGKEH